MINSEKLIVIDIETMINIFTIYCKDVKTGQEKSFIIFNDEKYEDQPLKLYNFLKQCVKNGYSFVTFNGINFDVQILHYFYEWCSEKQDPLYEFDNQYIIDILYEKAQLLIGLQDNEEKFKELIPERKLFIEQVDLFVQLHFNSKNKYTSLKWVSFTMNYPTIEEMPIPHDQAITKEEIDQIIAYNKNDVLVTYEFFNKVRFETEMRIALSKEYGRNLINASEPKMAREIFGKFLCEELSIPYSELKQQKTIRKEIKLKDIIFPYVKFFKQDLKDVLEIIKAETVNGIPNYKWEGNGLGTAFNVKSQNDVALKELQEKTGNFSLTRDKSKFNYTFNYHGLEVDLGLGGIHSCTKPGVYEPKEDDIMLDLDVTSMYPMLAIKNDLKPAHLGDSFCKIYNNIFLERKKYEKKDPRNYIMKILLNSTYGLSSEINSYFYDKQFTYAITINGQLSLLMLVEAIYMGVPNVQVLQKNTDGVTFIFKKEHLDMVNRIRKWWENVTNLSLEEAEYSKMVIQDVNNYLAISKKGDIKKKGLFETSMAYHKNPSHLIVPKALEQHFVYGKDYIEYIKNGQNSIYDYCGGVKKKSNFKLNLYKDLDTVEIAEEQQKVTRYYVSKPSYDSGRLVKDFDDGRKVGILVGKLVTPVNKINSEVSGDYNIDYAYYEKEAAKLIENITPSTVQTSLF